MPGETLDRIAAHHYDNSNEWRIIAEAKSVDDPTALKPGTIPIIPERPE